MFEITLSLIFSDAQTRNLPTPLSHNPSRPLPCLLRASFYYRLGAGRGVHHECIRTTCVYTIKRKRAQKSDWVTRRAGENQTDGGGGATSFCAYICVCVCKLFKHNLLTQNLLNEKKKYTARVWLSAVERSREQERKREREEKWWEGKGNRNDVVPLIGALTLDTDLVQRTLVDTS